MERWVEEQKGIAGDVRLGRRGTRDRETKVRGTKASEEEVEGGSGKGVGTGEELFRGEGEGKSLG